MLRQGLELAHMGMSTKTTFINKSLEEIKFMFCIFVVNELGRVLGGYPCLSLFVAKVFFGVHFSSSERNLASNALKTI